MAKRTQQQSTRKKASSRDRRPSASRRQAVMPFDKRNYLTLLGCVALIVLGYALMRIDNQVEGFISLYVAPLLLAAGYFGAFYAIARQPSSRSES